MYPSHKALIYTKSQGNGMACTDILLKLPVPMQIQELLYRHINQIHRGNCNKAGTGAC